MADYIARNVQASVSNGATAIPGTNLRQELIVQSNILQWVREGRVWGANVGTVTTPATFNGGTVIIYTTPTLALRVPAGKFIVPISMVMRWEATAGTIVEFAIAIGQNDTGAGTSTAVTPVNANTSFTGNSGILVNSVYTTTTATTLTNPVEVWRSGYWTDLDVAANPVPPGEWYPLANGTPVIVGGTNVATLGFYHGAGTSASGFMQVFWAEFNVGDW